MAFKSKKPRITDDQFDYKNPEFLVKFLSSTGKLQIQKAAGLSAKRKRLLTRAVKRARYLALLPYVGKVAGQSRYQSRDRDHRDRG